MERKSFAKRGPAIIFGIMLMLAVAFLMMPFSGLKAYADDEHTEHDEIGDTAIQIDSSDTLKKLLTVWNEGEDTHSGYFTADITLPGDFSYVIPSGKTVNLCLNGHKLDLSSISDDTSVITNYYGTLNIYDCGTTVHNWKYDDVDGKYVLTGDTGTFQNAGGCIYGYCASSSRVFFNCGTMLLKNVDFIGNTANSGVEFIYSTKGSLKLEDLTLAGNAVSDSTGSFIYSCSDCGLTLNKVNITYNATVGNLIMASGSIKMSECEITCNTGDYTIFEFPCSSEKDNVEVSGCKFNNNTVNSLYMLYICPFAENCTVKVSDCEITDNISNGGDLLYIYCGKANNNVEVSKCTIKGNQAVNRGILDILSTKENCTMKINDCDISNNKSSNHMMSVNLYGEKANAEISDCSIRKSEINKNYASLYIYSNKSDSFVKMIGCKIKDNTCSDGFAAGVELCSKGDFYLGGDLEISGNTYKGADSASVPCNLCLIKNSEYSSNVTLGTGTAGNGVKLPCWTDPIGVSVAAYDKYTPMSGQFTANGTAADTLLFKSDLDGLQVLYDAGGEHLKLSHIHSWTYSADGNKLTASCSCQTQKPAAYEQCEYKDTGKTLTLTLNADAKAYYSGYEVTASYSDDEKAAWVNELNVADLPEIIYEKKNSSGSWESISGAPVDAGSYRALAKVTKDSETYTAVKEFSITGKIVSATFTEPEVRATGTAATDSDLAIAEKCHYTGSISWSPADKTFGYNKEYTATVTLTAKENYEFDLDEIMALQGLADWKKLGSSTVSSMVFTKTFKATDKVKIISVTAPSVTGQLTAFTTEEAQLKALPSSVKVTVEDGSKTSMAITWALKEGTTYETASKAENLFTWTVKPFEYEAYDTNGNKMTGEVVIKNPEKEKETETEKETQKETEKETQKETEKETQKETEKETEKETQKETEKETEKETQTETVKISKAEYAKNSAALDSALSLTIKGKKAKVTWGKVSTADGYDVFVSPCSFDFPAKPSATIKKASKLSAVVTKTFKSNIKENDVYKAIIKAYRMIDGKKVYIGQSLDLHTAGSKCKKTNAAALSVTKGKAAVRKLTLKAGKSAKISAKVSKKESKSKKLLAHVAKVRFVSSNKAVAKVSAKGKITAAAKGKCTIYVIAENGLTKKVKVTVK